MRRTTAMPSLLACATAVSFAGKTADAPKTDAPVNAPAPATTETAKTAAARVAPEITPARMLELPARNKPRGSKSAYPFDTLTEVGMSFGVKNKTRNNMNSIVHNQNKAHLTDKLDAQGAKVFKQTKTTDATTGVVSMVATAETEKVATKKFYAVDVVASEDPDGASVRIVREL